MQFQPDSVASTAKTGLASGWVGERACRAVSSSWRSGLAAFCVAALLTACGQKGPLTMPAPIAKPVGAAGATAAASAPAVRVQP